MKTASIIQISSHRKAAALPAPSGPREWFALHYLCLTVFLAMNVIMLRALLQR